MFRLSIRVGRASLITPLLLLSSLSYAQSVEDVENALNDLKGATGLCEIRYRNDGFNSAMSFFVGCLNPAFDDFYSKTNAPAYMPQGVKSHALTMAAKVDTGEIDLLAAMTSVAEVANFTFSQLKDGALGNNLGDQSSVVASASSSRSAPTVIITQQQGPSAADLILMQLSAQPTAVSTSTGSGTSDTYRLLFGDSSSAQPTPQQQSILGGVNQNGGTLMPDVSDTFRWLQEQID